MAKKEKKRRTTHVRVKFRGKLRSYIGFIKAYGKGVKAGAKEWRRKRKYFHGRKKPTRMCGYRKRRGKFSPARYLSKLILKKPKASNRGRRRRRRGGRNKPLRVKYGRRSYSYKSLIKKLGKKAGRAAWCKRCKQHNKGRRRRRRRPFR